MGGLRRIVRHITDLIGVPTPVEGKFLRWKQDLSGLENADIAAFTEGHIHVYDAEPVETANGTRKTFSTAEPFRLDSLRVFASGIRLHKGLANDYEVLNTTTFRFFEAPDASEKIVLDYIKL